MASQTQIAQSRERYTKARPAFAEWLALTASERAIRGLPPSEAAFAKSFSMTDRTLRKWKTEDPAFQDLLTKAIAEQVRARNAVESLGHGTPSAVELDGDERSYHEIKRRVIQDAMAGEKNARDLYFKTYGKPYVEAEAAQLESDLAERSDEELIAELISCVGDQLLADTLASLGWRVSMPAPPAPMPELVSVSEPA